jgi:hypothetical protein
MIEELETKITTVEAEALEFKGKVHKNTNLFGRTRTMLMVMSQLANSFLRMSLMLSMV